MYDVRAQHVKVWEPMLGDKEALLEMKAAMESDTPPLPKDTVVGVKMQPWDLMLMANPIPHEVTPVRSGDRLVYVGFVGLNN